MATRLFKYLINDYYEEFCTNICNWVSRNLRIIEHSEAEGIPPGQDANSLREVYTDHVVPDEMAKLWNNRVGELLHKLSVGADPLASRPELVQRLTGFIVKSLLHVDDHPTLTRFFHSGKPSTQC